MRFLRVAALASIPVVGLASAPLFERALPPVPPQPITSSAPVARLSITGSPARTSVMSAALNGLEADVALGAASCADTVQTESRQVRYTAGVRHTDNPDHIAARDALAGESALLAELEAESAVVSAEIARLSGQLAEQRRAVSELADREAALSADRRQAAQATAEAAARVGKSSAAASELRRRSAVRESLYAEIASLQSRLPGLRAEASAQADGVRGVDVVALSAAAASAAAVVEEKKGVVAAARKQIKRAHRSGVDVEGARASLKAARGQLSQSEARLDTALAAVAEAERLLKRADETERAVLHATTALRRTQDELSAAPGHCGILAAEADKLPRLERRLGHRESEERQARLALERISSLHAQQDEQRAITADALQAQRHALSALQAGQRAQTEQLGQAQAVLDEIPARLSHSVRGALDYSVENWTRACEVFAWVSWEDASGQLYTERLHQQAVVSDAANRAHPEAGISADLREYGVRDDDLIAQADLALAGDIRDLLTARALVDDALEDTGR